MALMHPPYYGSTGGILAASWAVLKATGVDGYMTVAERLMTITCALREGIDDILCIEVCGSPVMTALSIRSCDSHVSIFAIADEMEKKGWNMERQLETLHFSILPSHTPHSVQQLLTSLREAVTTVQVNPALAHSGTAGVYRMVGAIGDKTVIIVEFFNELYTL